MKFTYIKQDEFGRPRDCGEYRSEDGRYWIIRYVPFESWIRYKSNADPRFAASFGANRLGDFGTFSDAADACERHSELPQRLELGIGKELDDLAARYNFGRRIMDLEPDSSLRERIRPFVLRELDLDH